VAQRCEPIRITEQKPPIALTSPQRRIYVFDFGQNLAGWVRLKVRGLRGTKITLRFGEVSDAAGSSLRTTIAVPSQRTNTSSEETAKKSGSRVHLPWIPLCRSVRLAG